ncbi:MAG TPA: hypothetical protein VFP34_13645, partial [Microlunatus sp.]|nr:hypothetical protein [Microlunatus sp.]
EQDSVPIRGRDGKQYPRRRRQRMAAACSICGEVHAGEPDECPWDLFAQGLGPRPDRQDCQTHGSADHRDSTEVVEVEAPSDREREDRADQTTVEQIQAATIVDSVTRAVCLVDELATLPGLVDEIEDAGVSAEEAGLAAGIRELIQHLRVQAVAIATLADRLERIAAPR